MAANAKCDVLFASSCIYYSEELPLPLIKSRANYIVVSHDREYHEDVLDRLFYANDFRCICERILPACLEKMNELQETRYGTCVKVFARSDCHKGVK